MEVKWHHKEIPVNLSHSKVKSLSLPSVEIVNQDEVAKGVIAIAVGGISGAVAVGGAFALDEWKALNGQALSTTSALTTPRGGTSSGIRRVRVRKAAAASPEAKLAARNERRERERSLMQQMGVQSNQMKSAGGAEPRGRYQSSAPGIPRSASMPELPPDRSPSPCSSPGSDIASSSPKLQRIQREKKLMAEMREKLMEEANGKMKRQEEMYQSPVSTESLILESMDIGAPALAHSFSFTELQQQAIDVGVHLKNAMQATSKEELRELIGRKPPVASPVSRLSSAYLLPSMRRRRSQDKLSAEPRDKVSSEPRDKLSSEPRDNLLWRQKSLEPQQKTNSTSTAETPQQDKEFLAVRRENAEKMLSGRKQRQSDSADCEPRSCNKLETTDPLQQRDNSTCEAPTDRQAFAAHLQAMELRHTEYVFGKIVLRRATLELGRKLAATLKTWQARCMSPVSI